MRDPDARSDSMITVAAGQTSMDATYQTCTATNPLTASRLTHRQGASWVMGEMCCTQYNHVSTPNKGTCAGLGFPAPAWPTCRCRCRPRAAIPAA